MDPTKPSCFKAYDIRGRVPEELNPDLARRIGLATHQSWLFQDMTAEENLLCYAELYGLDRVASRVDQVLELMGDDAHGIEDLRL